MRVRRGPWGLLIVIAVVGIVAFSFLSREPVSDLTGKRICLAVGGTLVAEEYSTIASSFAELNASVITVGPARSAAAGSTGEPVIDHLFSDIKTSDIDALIVVGDRSLAGDAAMTDLLKSMYATGKIIGSSASGTIALAATGLLSDKKVAASMAASGQFNGLGGIGQPVAEPVVTDGTIVTALRPSDCDKLALAVSRLLQAKR